MHAHPGQARNALLAGLLVTAAFVVVEAVAGFLTNSLALVSDAGHMLADSGGLVLALGAATLARRPASGRHTYGLARFEVLVVPLHVVILMGIAGYIVFESISHLRHTPEVATTPVMLVGAAGLAVNLAVVRLLHSHGSHNLNVRAATLEASVDAIGSVAVIVSAGIIALGGWQGIDAIARLARIDPHACGLGFLAAADWHHDPLGQQLDYFRRHMDWAASLNRPYPHLQRAWAWLHAHRPAPAPGGLCWGDAKLGNCVFRNGRLVAMLDWEGCHLGSPVMDLAWWITIDRCLSEGYGVPRLPGLPGREASVARWEAASGLPATDLAYYEVFSAFKLASIMARIGTLFQQRGLLPEGFEMDIDNGAARVLAKFGELHGLGSAP